MATQRESRLSRNIMKKLREEGYFCFKAWGNEMMMAGLPDIIVCAHGLFIGLETKLPESRDNVSAKQEYVHGLIAAAGGGVAVVCSPTEALAEVQRVLKRRLRYSLEKRLAQPEPPA